MKHYGRWALVLLLPGIVGLKVFFPVGIAFFVAAVLLATMAIMREKLGGRIMGAIALLVVAGLVWAMVVSISNQRRMAHGAKAAACMANLKTLGDCLLVYQDEKNAPPPDLQTFLKWDPSVSSKLLICPADPQKGGAGGTSYYYLPPGDHDPKRVVAADVSPCHGGKRCVLMADGSAQQMSEAGFQKLLALPINQGFGRVMKQPQTANGQ